MSKTVIVLVLLCCTSPCFAMRVKAQKAVLKDDKLVAAVSNTTRLNSSWFAWNILMHQERETLIPKYIAKLEGSSPEAKRLLVKFAKDYRRLEDRLNLSESLKDAIESLFRRNRAIIPYKYQATNIAVSKFVDGAKDLEFAATAKEIITHLSKKDLELVDLRKKLGEDIKHSYEHERIVRLEDYPKLLFVPHPHNSREIKRYFEAVIEHKAKVLVSLCSPYEASEVVPFWDDKRCEKLSETILYEAKKAATINDPKRAKEIKDHQLIIPRIVERKLKIMVDDKEHETVHLHYENWPDHQEAPDLEALNVLFDRKDSLLTHSKDICMLNCKATIGRSAVFFLSDLGRKRVDRMIADGVPFDEMKLNIVEIMLEGRRFRPLLSPNVIQLAQVFEIIGNHFEHLRIIAK